ncbi:MAG: hypothetical protein V1779_01475 [bacterium]
MIKHKDWIIIYAIFLIAFSIQFIVSLLINNWHFSYALDDPYIHLAMAKNLTENGIWGPTLYEFASTSSSPLYTLIISFFFLTGLKFTFISLLVNLVSVAFLLFFINKIMIKKGFNNKTIVFISLLIVVFAPAVALTLTGMEHLLHSAFILLLIYFSLEIVSKNQSNKFLFLFGLISLIATSLRFETLFVVLAISIILLIKKKFKPLFMIVLGGVLPVIILGLISILNSSYFLPNTLLTKGHYPVFTFPELLGQASQWIIISFRHPHILSCFVLLSLNIILPNKENRNLDNNWFTISIIGIVSLILHLTFARIGWFYRYEAYLVVLSLFSISPILNRMFEKNTGFVSVLKNNKLLVTILIISLIPLTHRLISSVYKSSLAPKNIYEQQIKLAEFLNEYQYHSVVLNDIGAACYYNNLQLVDMAGLANKEIIEAIKSGEYNTSFITDFTSRKNSRIAVIHEDIVDFKLPDNWKKAAYWKIKNNVVCYKDKIYFYSLKLSEHNRLLNNLKENSRRLPKDMKFKVLE